MPLNHWQYLGVTWKSGIHQITMNTGERYQHFGVSRSLAIRFARNPDGVLLKGYRFERVRRAAPNSLEPATHEVAAVSSPYENEKNKQDYASECSEGSKASELRVILRCRRIAFQRLPMATAIVLI
jgi:hypothetical protein